MHGDLKARPSPTGEQAGAAPQAMDRQDFEDLDDEILGLAHAALQHV